MILKNPNETRGQVPFSCDHCYNLGYKRKATINQHLKFGGKTLYCSKECHRLSMVTKIITSCKTCGVAFLIKNSCLNKTGNFCSKNCSAKHNNTGRCHTQETKEKIRIALSGRSDHRKETFCVVCGKLNPYLNRPESSRRRIRTTCSTICQKQRYLENSIMAGIASSRVRVKRSKDEIKLFDLIQSIFPNAEHNVPVVKKWDADIILRDQKIAIMWNGIWHRKQLSFSNHSLEKVQNRDRIKIKEFTEAGWTILIYEDDVWKPETAFNDFKEKYPILPFSESIKNFPMF